MTQPTFLRDPSTFPRSAAYATSPDAVEVTGAGVMVSYAQIHMLELIALGVERREASRVAWELFHELIRATGVRTSSEVNPAERGRVNCLRLSAQASAEALRMPIDEFRRRHDRHAPVARLHPEDRDRAVWLLDAVRRVSHGVDLPDAIRQASDAAAGKPRQRRAPATEDFIATELAACLEPLWWALLQAQESIGARLWRLWLREVQLEDQRPTVILSDQRADVVG